MQKVQKVVFHALDSLGITYGASHSELKIDAKGNIKLIEIGGRMGGDFIGSHLVELSTGIDFVKAVIEISRFEPKLEPRHKPQIAAVRFILSQEDLVVLEQIRKVRPELSVRSLSIMRRQERLSTVLLAMAIICCVLRTIRRTGSVYCLKI